MTKVIQIELRISNEQRKNIMTEKISQSETLEKE